MVVIFDLDDTLLDHSAAVQSAVARVHSEWHVQEPIDAFTDRWRLAHSRYYPKFLSGEISYVECRRLRIREVMSRDVSDEEADRMFEAYFAAYEHGWVLFPDVRQCLADLKSVRLGVITNGPSSEQRLKLERLGIAGRFEHIGVSTECGFAKPAPQIFWRACDAMGVAPGSTFYVGDHPDIDARAAIQAGLRGIWLDRARGAAPTVLKVVHSLSDLRNVIAIG